MKLYLIGHDYRYAAEQILLMLFPDERPEYPEAPESGNLSYTPAHNPTAETPTDTPTDTPLDAKQYGVTQYVNVPGYGRVTVEELARLIDAGVIREVAKSDGSYDYVVTGKTANKVVALTR